MHFSCYFFSIMIMTLILFLFCFVIYVLCVTFRLFCVGKMFEALNPVGSVRPQYITGRVYSEREKLLERIATGRAGVNKGKQVKGGKKDTTVKK